MKKPEIVSPLNTNSRIGVIDIERMFTGGEDSKSTPNIARNMASYRCENICKAIRSLIEYKRGNCPG